MMQESAPLTDFTISHGACARCCAALEAEQPLIKQYGPRILMYRKLLAAARKGDLNTCALLASEAQACGFKPLEIVVSLIQPGLAEIGAQWERGHVTPEDEQRFTAWCFAMLELLELPRAPTGQLELLIVQAPGSRHTLGPRIAEQQLLAAGVRTQAVADEFSLDRVLALCRERQVAWLGFSCALPHMVHAAELAAAALRAGGFTGKTIISGQAVRRNKLGWQGLRSELCVSAQEARELMARAAS